MKKRDLVVWVKKEACRKWLVQMIKLRWSDLSDWSELEGGSKYQNWQSKSRRKANPGAGSGSRSIGEEDNLQRQGWPSAGGDGKGFREKKNSGSNRRGLKKNVNKLRPRGRQNWYEGQGFQPQNRQHIQQFGRQERKGKVSRKREGMGGGGWRVSKGLHIRRSRNQTDIGGRRWTKGGQGLRKEGGSGWRRLEDDDDYDGDNSGNDDDSSGDYDDYGGEYGDDDYDSGSGWNQLETGF